MLSQTQHSSLAAEVKGVPLYCRLRVARKPPAVALHEADSLSRIDVWTGHNCCFCCQERRCLGVSIFYSLSFFSLYYRRQQRRKITGVSSQISFVALTKSETLVLRRQKQCSGLEQRSKCLFFPGTVIPLKVFPLVLLGWPVCRGIVQL